MIYLQLFLSYLKIGFFGFGGGYAMLSLIQNEIVTRHGGELTIENAEGGGCRVTVLLPQQNGETNGK